MLELRRKAEYGLRLMLELGLIDRQAMLDRRGAGRQATRRAVLAGAGENA